MFNSRQDEDVDRHERIRRIAGAAAVRAPVTGLTHRHYKYPARFSPHFVGSVIDALSAPGDLVLDPFMGGGTTVVEAVARGRRAIGCDINALAVFVTRVKTTRLTPFECCTIYDWANHVVSALNYHESVPTGTSIRRAHHVGNLNLPRARPIKKLLSLALRSVDELSTSKAKKFARCILLNVGQWALNGRRSPPTLDEFRARLRTTTEEMLNGAFELDDQRGSTGQMSPKLINGRCADLPGRAPFACGEKADLIITSPPYPGVHVLYHRWQVDGRKETAAPYWIAGCLDGQGAGFYNFSGRWNRSEAPYFDELTRSFSSLRSVVRDGAFVVQLVAFPRPRTQLRKYLDAMESCGFAEVMHQTPDRRARRVWREVPQRSWHANYHGATSSSREILLIHRAA